MVLILTAGCASAALPPTPMLPSVIPVPPTATAAPPASTATPMPTQTPQGQIVSFTAEDGVKLSGTLFLANGETAVVLAHMGIADQKSWQPFAGHIAGRGFTALTFDFRCFGLSDCGKMGQSESLFTQDIRAAIRFLRERGLKRIACMGASMGGTACMNAVLDQELAGMVVIASTAPLYMGKQYPEDLVNPAMPKLFIVADKDRYAQVVPATSFLYDRSPEPKKLKTFPGTVHGTELFATDSGAELRDLLTHFMEELATSVVKPTSTPTPYATYQEAAQHLARQTSLDKSTLTSMLDRLEEAGFVARVPSPQDRRKVLVKRTEKDKAWQKVYVQVSQEMTKLFYDGFAESEMDEFEQYLRRILENLTASDSA